MAMSSLHLSHLGIKRPVMTERGLRPERVPKWGGRQMTLHAHLQVQPYKSDQLWLLQKTAARQQKGRWNLFRGDTFESVSRACIRGGIDRGAIRDEMAHVLESTRCKAAGSSQPELR